MGATPPDTRGCKGQRPLWWWAGLVGLLGTRCRRAQRGVIVASASRGSCPKGAEEEVGCGLEALRRTLGRSAAGRPFFPPSGVARGAALCGRWVGLLDGCGSSSEWSAAECRRSPAPSFKETERQKKRRAFVPLERGSPASRRRSGAGEPRGRGAEGRRLSSVSLRFAGSKGRSPLVEGWDGGQFNLPLSRGCKGARPPCWGRWGQRPQTPRDRDGSPQGRRRRRRLRSRQPGRLRRIARTSPAPKRCQA